MNRQTIDGVGYVDFLWNPITGCQHDCKFDCWARRTALRWAHDPKSIYSKIGFKPYFHEDRFDEPSRRQKPARIGVVYMGDLFGEWVPHAWIYSILKEIEQCPQHRFILLTKNPKRFNAFDIPSNAWCGTSTTGSKEEFKRVETLLKAVPRNRFISLEPWTGGIPANIRTADWLIIGGLTGKGAATPPIKNVARLIRAWRSLTDTPIYIKENTGYPVKVREYPPSLILPQEQKCIDSTP